MSNGFFAQELYSQPTEGHLHVALALALSDESLAEHLVAMPSGSLGTMAWSWPGRDRPLSPLSPLANWGSSLVLISMHRRGEREVLR